MEHVDPVPDAEKNTRMQQGAVIILDHNSSSVRPAVKETPLPFSGRISPPAREVLPEKLRLLRRLYDYGPESHTAKAVHFYRQGMFMRDYEDDVPWTGDFTCYFPTYQDLTTRQLRGYFTWRSHIRRGEFLPIPASAAYLYLYELLNGIGTASVQDSLEKLKSFEEGYLDSGIGDPRMRQNLRRWMLDLALVHGLPAETACRYADPEMLQNDEALAILKDPASFSDEEVFRSLCRFGGRNTDKSPVITGMSVRGMHLFSEAWRKAVMSDRGQKDNLFFQCFGRRVLRLWYPLANALWYRKSRPEDTDCVLNDCRTYRCRDGVWQVYAYEKPYFDRRRLRSFLREADLKFRRYLKTGRYLREKPEDTWAAPYADAVISEEKQALLEAAVPKITIDLSGLDRIRRDAAVTRDSLLTGEDPAEEIETSTETVPVPDMSGTLEDPVQIQVLQILLQGGDPAGLLRSAGLMPSLTADAINEALFDEFQDTVLLCEDDRLILIEDYKEELSRLFGGK